jgi:gluconate 5-dehydrogenase
MTQAIVENPLLRGYLVDRTPTGRIGEPGDVAHAAVFLASEAAGFVNGHVLTVDGGITGGLYSAAAARLAEQAAGES